MLAVVGPQYLPRAGHEQTPCEIKVFPGSSLTHDYCEWFVRKSSSTELWLVTTHVPWAWIPFLAISCMLIMVREPRFFYVYLATVMMAAWAGKPKQAALAAKPNLRRLRCCRRPFFPTSRLHLQCSLILSPNFSYFDLYRPFVSISGKFGDDLWWFTVALLTLRLGTCAPWCAMQVSSLSGKVVDKLSKPLSRSQQIFPSSRMV